MKQGFDALSGKLIGGVDYLKQRLWDAFNTELGSLVGGRQYGSRLHEIIDKNVDRNFEMSVYVRVAECIANKHNGLDDIRLVEMSAHPLTNGKVEINLTVEIIENGEVINLDRIIINERSH